MKKETYKAVVSQKEGLKVEVESRGFKVIIDEPEHAGGTNLGMTPVELTLGSLGACQVITAIMFAPHMGVELEDIKVELEGDLDLDSFTGENPEAQKGFTDVRFNFIIKSGSPKEAIEKLIEHVESICPVGQSLLQAVTMQEAKITIE